MTVKEAGAFGIEKLINQYDAGEATAIMKLVLEHLIKTSQPPPQKILTAEEQAQLEKVVAELQTSKPVQYVLKEAWFCNLKMYVDENVLIPRPETEELVEWIISNCKFPVDQLKILDVGSGSGCIPIALKRRIRKAEVWSCDTSAGALSVARRNAETLGTPVHFMQLDFLDRKNWDQLPVFDLIVSNPPYIPEKDKEEMHPNVLKFEPSAALFVPDNDPLVFYTAIAEFGKTHLSKDGFVYLEVHENYGTAVKTLFDENGYSTELKKDMQEKDRMIRSGLK